jgi:hypothetical protein
MLMIIFGAGASFDCVVRPAVSMDERYRPPLGEQLFDDRDTVMTPELLRRPVLGPIANEVRSSAGVRDVEQVFADLVGRSLTSTTASQVLNARYYLKSVIETCTTHWAGSRFGWATHHATLVDMLVRDENPNREALLVTFNYDLLLEQALAQLGYKFTALADYVSRPLKLFKLHGSTNWGRVVGQRSNDAMPPEEELLLDPMATINGMTDEIVLGNEVDPAGRLLLPAIAVPVREKDGFDECPPDHVQALTDSIPSVRRLLIIGWRGADKKLPSLIAKHAPALEEVQIVSRDIGSASVTAEHLLEAGVVGDYRFLGEGFTAFMRLAARTGRIPGHDEFSTF